MGGVGNSGMFFTKAFMISENISTLFVLYFSLLCNSVLITEQKQLSQINRVFNKEKFFLFLREKLLLVH